MGIFDSPGQFDEQSGWYWLRDRDSIALDQAIKARRAADMAAVRASVPVPTNDPATERRIEQLQDKGIIDADEFSQRIRQIDLLDGKLDKR